MNFILSETEKLLQKTAREFADNHLRPEVIERDKNAEFPAEQIKMMGRPRIYGNDDLLKNMVVLEWIQSVIA